MNREKTFWLIVFLILIAITAYFVYPYFKKYPSQCGIVIDKKQPTAMDIHKHSADIYIENKLVINTNGKIKSINVTDDTFYNHKIGDRICFDKSYKDYHPLKALIGVILSVIVFIILVMIIIISIVDLYLEYIAG